MSSVTRSHEEIPPRFLIPKIYNPDDWKDTILDHKTFTSEDYNKLPEGSPYQLIGGKLIMTPAPEVYHQQISRNLEFKLHEFVIKNGLGEIFDAPIDVKITENDIYQPDIIFIHKDRMDIIGIKNIKGPPDIVVEILSPSTAYYDLREKYDIYEKSGVKEYWIIDPNSKKIEIFGNKSGKFHLNNEARETGSVSSVVLAGFAVSLSDIF